MASPCLCKPPTASEPASHVKPVLKQTFGRASPEAAREAAGEALPNGALLLTNSWLPSAFWFFGWRYDFIFLISMWFLIIYMKFEFRFFGVTYIYYLYTCHFCTDFVKLLQFQCILMVFLNFLGKEMYP